MTDSAKEEVHMMVFGGIDEDAEYATSIEELDDYIDAGYAEDCIRNDTEITLVVNKELDEPDEIEFAVYEVAHAGPGKALLEKTEDGQGESKGEGKVGEPDQGDEFEVAEGKPAAIGEDLGDGETTGVFFFYPVESAAKSGF